MTRVIEHRWWPIFWAFASTLGTYQGAEQGADGFRKAATSIRTLDLQLAEAAGRVVYVGPGRTLDTLWTAPFTVRSVRVEKSLGYDRVWTRLVHDSGFQFLIND